MTARFWKEIGTPILTSDKMYSINYGLDRVRFTDPLRIDPPARARVILNSVKKLVMLGYNTPSHVPWMPVYDHLTGFHNHLVMQPGDATCLSIARRCITMRAFRRMTTKRLAAFAITLILR